MNNIYVVAYVVVLATCALSAQSAPRLTEPGHKTKRSAALINDLLQTARLRYSLKGAKMYTKIGSFSDAVADFQRLQPKEVDVVAKKAWYGTVGDRTISLQNPRGRPILYMWKRQRGIERSDEMIMDKIEYL